MKLTIALMTYNRGSTYLRYSIEAILSQTHSDFELLILDNHSKDNTPSYVIGLKDPRITYIRQPPDSTTDLNFCTAIWMSCGKYVLVTHDDDIMEPTLVERQLALISKHPKLLCVASNVSLIDEHSNIIQTRLYNIDCDRIFKVGEYIKTYLEEKLWLPTPTYMYRRDAVLRFFTSGNGGDQIKIKTNTPSGDILMNCYLNSFGPIGLLADPLLRYRQHKGQESRNVHQGQPLVDILKVIKKTAKANPILRQYSAPLNAALARFQIQNLFFRFSKPTDMKRMTRSVAAIKSRLQEEIPPDQRAMDAIIPFEISVHEIKLELLCTPGNFKKLLRTPANTGATQGFRNWLKLIHAGRNLFHCQPKLTKIAVFGSMMAAFLIVLEARRAGIEVVCCVDSSPARIGKQIFGVPILSLMDFKWFDRDLDAVILSNERDHEDAIIKLLAPYLPQSKLQVLSWKELAFNSLKFTGAPLHMVNK